MIRCIGAGGMGVVHEAWDKERNTRVALKTLTGLTPHALEMFKNEFRSLADVSHPNLAALYELFSEEGQWFFSMEYVEGGHFLEHVRPGSLSIMEQSTMAADAIGQEASTYFTGELPDFIGRTGAAPGRCDPEKLAASLEELTRAVMALHAEGIVHRDLKPLNVKVTPEGRVVVLDFGLAAHAAPGWFGDTIGAAEGIVGTVLYMSPEQASGDRVTEAADWYAVGVMVYEALTGNCPFEGPTSQVLLDKQRLDPPRVSLPGDVSGLWEAICSGLLERDPERRMRGDDVLALLARKGPGRERREHTPRPAERIFVGRARELADLRGAWAAAEATTPSVVFVHGRSGIGKSALIEQFLRELAGKRGAIILSGRCYERESMPYKAFDGVVDSLARYMSSLPRHEAAELAPRDAGALAQVFPVLCRTETIASAPLRSSQSLDRHELRRKGFSALRELLARLGDRRRFVIHIDDLQWGDVDSAALFRELLRPPDAPRFLFVGAYRSEYEGRSAALDALLGLFTGDLGLERREVPVGPLSSEDTRELAARLMSADEAVAGGRIEDVVRECEGSPYLLQEIAGDSDANAAAGADGAPTLNSVLYRRVEALGPDSRRLLETVAVSVRPLRERDAFRAAGSEADDPRILVALRAGRLIRGTGARGEIEPYHDRVRETVISHLSADTLRERHWRLAVTLEASTLAKGRIDDEALATHFEGAGEHEKASRYYSAAAERATAALAFRHAAELAQRALDLSSAAGEERRRLTVKLADALGNAGRGPEAARAYREAEAGARAPELFELERKEAYWFATSGHAEEGTEALNKMLARVHLKVPGPLGQLIGLTASQIRLLTRGLDFQEKAEAEIPTAALDRIDAYWDAARSFGMIDAMAAMYLMPQGLLLALDSGEPQRVARVLALHNIGLATLRLPGHQRWFGKFRARCGELAERSGAPYLRGLYRLSEGMVNFFEGNWRESLERFAEAEKIFGHECGGASWELASVRIFSMWDLAHSGRYAELCRAAPLVTEEGKDRGDLYQAVSVAAGPQPICELAAGRPAAAHKMLEDSLDRWSRRRYNVQLAVAAFVRAWIYLYEGQARLAWESISRAWPDVQKNHYLRASGTRQWLYAARAQCALALAETGAERKALLKTAEHDAGDLETDGAGFATALADLIRAGCAHLEGERAEAITLLERTIAEAETAELGMIALAARRRLGEVVGGERGRSLVSEAEAGMREEGVREPDRMARVFANGFGAGNLGSEDHFGF